MNTVGSYECSCKEGYYGSGDSCFPGRCPEANCPKNQKCISPTTIDCDCKNGFRLTNFNDCVDFDECEEMECDDRSECLNTLGSYICHELHSSTIQSTYTTPGSTTTKTVFSSTTKVELTSIGTTALTTQTTLTTKELPSIFQ